MKLPIHAEPGQGKYVDLLDANGATVALDLVPVSAAFIVKAANHADELAEQLAEAQTVLQALYNHTPLPCGILDCIDSNDAIRAYREAK